MPSGSSIKPGGSGRSASVRRSRIGRMHADALPPHPSAFQGGVIGIPASSVEQPNRVHDLRKELP
jgi:hypothetical protein